MNYNIKKAHVVGVLILSALAVCVNAPLVETIRRLGRSDLENRFFDEIEERVTSGRQSFLIKELVLFEWDKLCVLSSYDDKGSIPTADAAALKDINLHHDNAWAFIFLKQEKVIAILQSNGEYFFEEASGRYIGNRCLTNGAMLLVQRTLSDTKYGRRQTKLLITNAQ